MPIAIPKSITYLCIIYNMQCEIVTNAMKSLKTM